MELNINDVRYSFVFPNETLHSDLLVRAVVENVAATSDPLVVPLMVSEGYFTGRKIPGLLQNISYAYPEEGERALTLHRGDVKINSGHPSDGHVMTFEYILGSTEDITIDEGADIVHITADNYVYTFTRKSTNDSFRHDPGEGRDIPGTIL